MSKVCRKKKSDDSKQGPGKKKAHMGIAGDDDESIADGNEEAPK